MFGIHELHADDLVFQVSRIRRPIDQQADEASLSQPNNEWLLLLIVHVHKKSESKILHFCCHKKNTGFSMILPRLIMSSAMIKSKTELAEAISFTLAYPLAVAKWFDFLHLKLSFLYALHFPGGWFSSHLRQCSCSCFLGFAYLRVAGFTVSAGVWTVRRSSLADSIALCTLRSLLLAWSLVVRTVVVEHHRLLYRARSSSIPSNIAWMIIVSYCSRSPRLQTLATLCSIVKYSSTVPAFS